MDSDYDGGLFLADTLTPWGIDGMLTAPSTPGGGPAAPAAPPTPPSFSLQPQRRPPPVGLPAPDVKLEPSNINVKFDTMPWMNQVPSGVPSGVAPHVQPSLFSMANLGPSPNGLGVSPGPAPPAITSSRKRARPNVNSGGDFRPPPSRAGRSRKENTRLAKKAEAARVSRRKKKAYVQELEESVITLTQRIAALKQKRVLARQRRASIESSSNPSSPLAHLDMDNSQLVKIAEEMVQNPTNRRKRADYYLDRVAESVDPGAQFKFILWLGKQNEEMYHDAAAPSNQGGPLSESLLHSLLRKELGLSDHQIEFLSNMREKWGKQNGANRAARVEIEAIRKDLMDYLQKLSTTINDLQDVVTKEQLMRLVLWTYSPENAWSIKMLKAVWADPSFLGTASVT